MAISFPDDEPSEGVFITCSNSQFLGRKIQISNPVDLSKKIAREYGGHSGLSCTTEPLEIRLNKEDGLELFGKPLFKDGKPIRKGLAVQIQ